MAIAERRPSSVVVEGPGEHFTVTLCEQIRNRGYDGVLLAVLSSSARAGIITALDAGADDCLPAPVEVDLLLARLRAGLRRPSQAPSTPLAPVGLLPDEAWKVAIVAGNRIQLTPTEARILHALCDAGGAFVPPSELKVTASPLAPLSSASLQVHLSHLRKKLGLHAWRIQNQRASGYCIVLDP